MRDSARFHFGFTVPFVTHMSAGAVVTAVAATQGDLGLVPALAPPGTPAWWTALEGDGPKIIARLPFVERPDHPAALPVYAIARPQADALVTDVAMWSIRVAGWSAKAAQALAAKTTAIATPDTALDGAALLVAVPESMPLSEITATLTAAGASVRSQALVGSHARRYTVAADGKLSAGH
jgi:hypothetical protein